jgi:ethanolamine transporter EutH
MKYLALGLLLGMVAIGLTVIVNMVAGRRKL